MLGVDTVVDVDGVEHGKARDRSEAESMLRALFGRAHHVHTAHCLHLPGGEVREAVSTAVVQCGTPGHAELLAYLESLDWQGKAGAYGIQDEGARFLRVQSGPMDAVIGLHVEAVQRLLRGERAVRLWPDGLAARIAIALLVAVGLLVALDFWVAHADAAAQAPRTTVPAMGPEPRALARLGPPARAVVLCSDNDVVPADAAPVLAVMGNGGLVVRRPPPLARGPVAAVPELAALVLPKRELAELDPAQRAAVVDALGRLCGAGAAPEAVRTLGIAASREQIAALLRWVGGSLLCATAYGDSATVRPSTSPT